MKYNRRVWNTLFLPVLLNLCLLFCCLLPIRTESVTAYAADDVSSEEVTEDTFTSGYFTFHRREDGYFDVIAFDKESVPNPESYQLLLSKSPLNTARPEFIEANPTSFVASIKDRVFQDTTFYSIQVTGDIIIGNYAFAGTTAIDQYDSMGSTLGGERATIGDYAFAGATFNHTAHTSAQTIGNHAFDGATFSDNEFPIWGSPYLLEYSIGDYAFAGTNLTSFTLPGTLTYLGTMAFPNVDTLTITISNCYANIEAFHLEELTNVTFCVVPNTPVYYTLQGYNAKIEIPDTIIGGDSVADYPNIITDIPYSIPLTAAAEDASTSAPATTTADTPKTDKLITRKNAVYKITKASTAAFVKPTSKKVTSLSIPATIKVNGKKYKITKVAAKACLGCKKLKRVTLGKNITTVGDSAFAQCSKLEEITFGINVKTIGKRVLYNDKKIKKIRFRSKKLKSIGKKTFYQVPKSVNIEVPTSKVSHYVKLINKAK